jgi:uracil-DNA glycosylase
VALGALAYKVLAAKCSSISLVQGNWQESKFRGIPLLPLFHPSPLNMNAPLKRGAFKKGLKNLEEYLR